MFTAHILCLLTGGDRLQFQPSKDPVFADEGTYGHRADRRQLFVVTESNSLLVAPALALLTEFHLVTEVNIDSLSILV